MDAKWWEHYGEAVVQNFQGERYTTSLASGLRARRLTKRDMEHYGNSGAAAVSLAEFFGAARIILLGYDCRKTSQLAHWHGDHPKGLGNAGSLPSWAGKFAKLAKRIRHVSVVNCSPGSALMCFPHGTLEAALA